MSTERKPGHSSLRLHYLDGVRGLTALYILFFHVWCDLSYKPQLRLAGEAMPAWLQAATAWAGYGIYSVGIFIVLSGYCLMLPVVRSPDGQLRDGVAGYLRRRAWRILPPYFAALGFSLLVIALVPAGNEQSLGFMWDKAMDGFSWQGVLAHLLLVHNWDKALVGTISAPLWSVATEWQIYFLFPALLLPLWRRAGIAAAVAAGFVVGLAPMALLDGWLSWAAPWFVGFFALGMAAAVWEFAPPKGAPRLTTGQLQLATGALWSLLVLAAAVRSFGWLPVPQAVFHLLIAVATPCLLMYCTRLVLEGKGATSVVLRLLEAPPVLTLGTFSYSLYLVHAPLQGVSWILAGALPVAGSVQLLLFAPLTVLISLLCAWGFYQCAERPFVRMKLSTKEGFKEGFMDQRSDVSLNGRVKEVAAGAAVGWIPAVAFGTQVRRAVYRRLLARVGDGTAISTSVEFLNARCIELGARVRIDSNVRLDARGHNNRIEIADEATLASGVVLQTLQGGSIQVGEQAYIGPYSCLSGPGTLSIGRDCLIAAHAEINAAHRPGANPAQPGDEASPAPTGIVIEDDCWIGHDVTIVAGVRIGRGSIVGAGAVVTGDLPAYAIAAGVPAQVLGHYQPSPANPALGVSSASPWQRIEGELDRTLGQVESLQKDFGSLLMPVVRVKILHNALKFIHRTLEVETVTVLLAASNKNVLQVHASVGLEQEVAEGICIQHGRGIAGRIAASRQPLFVDDLSRVEIESPILRNRGLQQLAGVPLFLDGRVVGVFHIGTTTRRLSIDDCKRMLTIARQLGRLAEGNIPAAVDLSAPDPQEALLCASGELSYHPV
ncbi:MAG: acyltransferase family protein [Aphanocapsa lilacina HA4352-LM1]|nr:acyltransferase family protein [Aphanocapsa lilacina HA4352-LM1]